MLHNIRKDRNLGFLDDEEQQEIDEADEVPHLQSVPRAARQVEGLCYRDAYVDLHFK